MCQLDEERVDAGSKTETVGNATFFGQIAHLIDTLHLSYTEVFEVIPYRNLLMMQRDKLLLAIGPTHRQVVMEMIRIRELLPCIIKFPIRRGLTLPVVLMHSLYGV